MWENWTRNFSVDPLKSVRTYKRNKHYMVPSVRPTFLIIPELKRNENGGGVPSTATREVHVQYPRKLVQMDPPIWTLPFRVRTKRQRRREPGEHSDILHGGRDRWYSMLFSNVGGWQKGIQNIERKFDAHFNKRKNIIYERANSTWGDRKKESQ